jgi:hypothetical protein
MRTYAVFDKAGVRSPVFQLPAAYIRPSTIAALLSEADGVSDLQSRKMFAMTADIHVRFNFFGRPYIVWEPFADSSRYWVGPADMVVGEPDVPKLERPEDIERLELPFKRHRPPIVLKLFGDLVSLNFKGLFRRK